MKKTIIYLIGLLFVMIVTMNFLFAQNNESDIIITEILYNPPGTDTLEFIELYNAGTVAYNLDGYKLSGPFTFTFDDVTIDPGSCYVIANDSAAMRRAFGIPTGHWGSSSLVNTNKMIKIVDAQQNLVDSLHYYNDSPWPTISTNAGGPSIELTNIYSDNSQGENWQLSTTFGVVLNNGTTLYCSPGILTTPVPPPNSFLVSGTVKDVFDNPINNLLITATSEIYTHTDQSGYYELYLEGSWTGIIKVDNPQYIYTPEYYQVSNIQANMENLDFTAGLLPPGWIFNKTSDSHSFCILTDAFPNNLVSLGSWIGVFYNDDNDEKCCGAVQYINNATYCLNAWAANPLTNDEGFTENGEIMWKLYDEDLGENVNIFPEYSSGPIVFQIDGVSIISSFELDVSTQELIIPKGWSAISSYIIPSDLQLDNIFSEHLNQIVAITNDEGIYIPNDPNSTLDNWDPESGWLIKSNENISTLFSGSINSNLDVEFSEGWTLFPIKTDSPIQISELFAGKLNNIDIIKGYGFNEIYIPGISQSFELLPGKAYKARINTPTTVTFNFNGKGFTSYIPSKVNNEIYDDITKTSSDHVFVFTDSEVLKAGDQILAYANNNLCVGVGEVSNESIAVFKVYGDDFITEIIDGLLENEKIKFKIIRNNITYNINYQFAANTINYDHFVNDGISYISKVKINFDGVKDYSSLLRVYPNPAKEFITVEFNNTGSGPDKIKIYDFTGKLIKTTKVLLPGKVDVYIDDLTNGIYYLNYGDYNIKFIKE